MNKKHDLVIISVASMLVTDVGDEMCWWQIWDVGDQFNDHIENIYDNESAIIIWIQSLS